MNFAKPRLLKRALLSVFDKDRLIELVTHLSAYHVELVATGSTAKLIQESGFMCKEVSEITNFPEILDGRVKTLHPKIHGGILAKPQNKDHQQTLNDQGIEPFDLIIAGLYPFEETLKKPAVSFDDTIEMIDIGGPCMIRAGAKNYESVCVITSTEQYDMLLEEIAATNGGTSLSFRKKMAQQAFTLTAHYDNAIAKWMDDESSDLFAISDREADTTKTLSYGENPHQKAKIVTLKPQTYSAAHAKLLQGEKALSYNNYVDSDFAFSVVSAFDSPAVSVIKHKVTCGFACAKNGALALKRAIDSDKVSAFGGIIAANVSFDLDMAVSLDDLFLEVIIAPEFETAALSHLKQKKNLRVLATGGITDLTKRAVHIRQICDGFLMQDLNLSFPLQEQMKTKTNAPQPSESQWRDVEIAVKLASFANSNAIAIVSEGQLIGLGSGQTSRVRACEIAAKTAKQYHAMRLREAVAASDGFFPFYDGIASLHEKGIRIIAHPGGSKNDEPIQEQAQQAGITLIEHGVRSFAH